MKIVATIYSITLLMMLSFNHAIADSSRDMREVNALLDRDQAPVGVVFEIVDWEDDYLEIAIPWVNTQIKSLRARFPALDIAVVSHGSEQFSLLKDADAAFPEIHSKVQRLIIEHDVKLELCLGHANMRGFQAADFPQYVDIQGSGPAQIAAYEALGYDLVLVSIE
jgi:hypothetical protein